MKPQKDDTVLHCEVKGCKSKVTRFGFCADHHDQYKFGLINKHGQRVPDYDKKLEHYQSHKQDSRKVA